MSAMQGFDKFLLDIVECAVFCITLIVVLFVIFFPFIFMWWWGEKTKE